MNSKKGIPIRGSYIDYGFCVLCRFCLAVAPAEFGDWHGGLKYGCRR